MGIKEWDEQIAPVLGRIGRSAWWVQYYANDTRQNVLQLAVRPEWETVSLEEIEKAIKSLEDAIANLKEAREKYMRVAADPAI